MVPVGQANSQDAHPVHLAGFMRVLRKRKRAIRIMISPLRMCMVHRCSEKNGIAFRVPWVRKNPVKKGNAARTIII